MVKTLPRSPPPPSSVPQKKRRAYRRSSGGARSVKRPTRIPFGEVGAAGPRFRDRSEFGEPASQKLADFYAACLDDAAIERAGLAPLRALLARTTRITDAASWLTAVIELHKLGIFVVWDHHAVPDRTQAIYVTTLDAPAPTNGTSSANGTTCAAV